jgi:GT2 family glycosyltransferase
MPDPICDIIVPIYGQIPIVEECIGRLASTTSVNYKLTLIDDATPGLDMRKYLSTKIAQATLMHNSQNMGFGQTVNKAARSTYAKYIMILNSDTQALPGWLDVLIDDLETYPDHGVAGALLLFHPESVSGPPGRVQHAGMTFDVRRRPYHRYIGWTPDHPKVRQYRDDLQAVTGACMLVRRSLWNKIGGFAKEYGRGTFEDVELCIKARLFNQKVVYVPDAMLYHRVGASAELAGGFPLQMNYQLCMNRVGGAVYYDEWKTL